MSRIYALLLVSVLLSACGQPALTATRPAVPIAAAAADTDSVRGTVRVSVTRYLATHHPNTIIDNMKVARTAQNGMQTFSAECHSPRQFRRLDGQYDVAQGTAAVTKDTLRP
jgi:hypothetical protein